MCGYYWFLCCGLGGEIPSKIVLVMIQDHAVILPLNFPLRSKVSPTPKPLGDQSCLHASFYTNELCKQ